MKKQVKKSIENFNQVCIKKEQQVQLKGGNGIIHEDILDG